MTIKDKYQAWASQQEDPEWAFEDAWPEDIEPGDMAELDKVLDDLSGDFSPLPPELIAHRLSVWSGQEIPIDSPLVQDNKKYRSLVLDMDYPDDFDTSKLNDIKQFKILLQNSVSPEIKDSVASTFNYILKLAGQPEIENVYVVKGFGLVGTIEDGFVLTDGKQVKIIDNQGNQINADAEAVMQNMKNFPKQVINDEQLINLLGMKLYNLVKGNDGIGLFDLP